MSLSELKERWLYDTIQHSVWYLEYNTKTGVARKKIEPDEHGNLKLWDAIKEIYIKMKEEKVVGTIRLLQERFCYEVDSEPDPEIDEMPI